MANKRIRNKQIKMNKSFTMDTRNFVDANDKETLYNELAKELQELTLSLRQFKDDLKEEHLQQLKEDMKKLKEAE